MFKKEPLDPAVHQEIFCVIGNIGIRLRHEQKMNFVQPIAEVVVPLLKHDASVNMASDALYTFRNELPAKYIGCIIDLLSQIKVQIAHPPLSDELSKSQLEKIIKLLEECNNIAVKRNVLTVLKNQSSKRIVNYIDKLIEILNGNEPHLFSTVFSLLEALGYEALRSNIRFIVACLESNNLDIRVFATRCIEGLIDSFDYSEIDLLLKLIEKQNGEANYYAANLLFGVAEKIPRSRIMELILVLLSEEKDFVKERSKLGKRIGEEGMERFDYALVFEFSESAEKIIYPVIKSAFAQASEQEIHRMCRIFGINAAFQFEYKTTSFMQKAIPQLSSSEMNQLIREFLRDPRSYKLCEAVKLMPPTVLNKYLSEIMNLLEHPDKFTKLAGLAVVEKIANGHNDIELTKVFKLLEDQDYYTHEQTYSLLKDLYASKKNVLNMFE